MSGHNRWSKVKNRKAVTDARKSALFSKHSRLIALESKKADGDRNAPGLRAAIEKAKKESMPNENIERAVQKGAGGDAGNMEEVVYEAYGPGGVALIITALTDNKNRTAPEIKHLLATHGTALAAPGSALWAFTREGGEYVPQSTQDISDDEGEKLGVLIDALDEHDDVQEVFTNAS